MALRPSSCPSAPGVRWRARLLLVASVVYVLLVSGSGVAWATERSVDAVIENLTGWIVGIAGVTATLFLTVGGLRYMTAGGDPGEVEAGKRALKSAAVGYAIVLLAPVLKAVLKSIVGAG